MKLRKIISVVLVVVLTVSVFSGVSVSAEEPSVTDHTHEHEDTVRKPLETLITDDDGNSYIRTIHPDGTITKEPSILTEAEKLLRVSKGYCSVHTFGAWQQNPSACYRQCQKCPYGEFASNGGHGSDRFVNVDSPLHHRVDCSRCGYTHDYLAHQYGPVEQAYPGTTVMKQTCTQCGFTNYMMWTP